VHGEDEEHRERNPSHEVHKFRVSDTIGFRRYIVWGRSAAAIGFVGEAWPFC
jgi:hypothetical protein